MGAAVFVGCLWALQGYLGVLEFDRQQVLSGEFWRLWTGHLVHANMAHFALNVAAALAIYFMFFTRVRPGELVLYGFLFSALISVTLLSVYPDLVWYNGLSGLLHALVACFSIRLASRGKARIFWAGLAIVWAKVLLEALHFRSGQENLLGDLTVISEAHLVGAFFGTLVAFVCLPYWRAKNKTGARCYAQGSRDLS